MNTSTIKRTITHTMVALVATVLLASCNNEASLQRYFVDNQEAENFITQDIPLSMLKIDESTLSTEQKEAYHSVKRLNFLGYKATNANSEFLKAEVAKVKTILSSKTYNELMAFSHQGNTIDVKYIGNDTQASEVVVFGSSKKEGFAILRVLGDNMSPDKMITLASVLQNANLNDVFKMFKS